MRVVSRGGRDRSQSALEYLTTYGWAILVIAVVLVVLFELGVFNTNNLGPRAQPGACSVSRPNGANTVQLISLEGVCNNELPEYVGAFSGSTMPVVYTPMNSYQSVPATITGWAYISSLANACDGTIYSYVGGSQAGMGFGNGALPTFPIMEYVDSSGGMISMQGTSKNISMGKWVFEAITISGSAATSYFDGSSISSQATAPRSGAMGTSGIGYRNGLVYCNIDGYVSNVQVYNASLSPSEIKTLYQEGIGGAPLALQNLIGWWPLDGNVKDYSGNGNNGRISGSVTFTNQWTSGYTAP